MSRDAVSRDPVSAVARELPRADAEAATRPARSLAWFVALTVVAWSGALVYGGFSYDDSEAIFENPYVAGRLPWAEAFVRDYWHHRGAAGHWRPFALLSLRLDHALWNDWAVGYHATNLLLHALVVLSAGCALRALAQSPREQRAADWGLALFAVHPVLADSVAWISGRTSMLSALGPALAAAWLARLPKTSSGASSAATSAASSTRARLGALLAIAGVAGAGLAAGLAGKEDAVLWLPLFALLAARRGRARELSGPMDAQPRPGATSGLRSARTAALAAALAGAGLALALVLWLRAGALGTGALPAAPGSPLAGLALGERLLVGGRAFVEALSLAAAPVLYPPHYALESWSTPADATAGVLGLALGLALAGLCTVAFVRRPGLVAGSGLAALLASAPLFQLVPLGEVFAPRFLYLPALCAVPCAGALLARLVPRVLSRRAQRLALLALIALAWQRARIYADTESFWRTVVASQPDDERAWNALGLAATERGDVDEARRSFLRAHELDPQYSRPLSNLGRLEVELGHPERALDWLAQAVSAGPSNPIAHTNLASVLLRLDEPAAAARAYERATVLAPGLFPAWRGLSRARLEAGDAAGERQAIERALELDPGDARARELARRIAAEEAP